MKLCVEDRCKKSTKLSSYNMYEESIYNLDEDIYCD